METEDAIKLAVGAIVLGYVVGHIRSYKKLVRIQTRYNHNMDVAGMRVSAQNKYIMDVNNGVDPTLALGDLATTREFIDLIEKSI